MLEIDIFQTGFRVIVLNWFGNRMLDFIWIHILAFFKSVYFDIETELGQSVQCRKQEF